MLGGTPRAMNSGGFPEEGSRGETDIERVMRDTRGELALGVWGWLPSNLVTSPGKGGLLAAGRFWVTFPDAIQDGDHARVNWIWDEKKQPQIVPGHV